MNNKKLRKHLGLVISRYFISSQKISCYWCSVDHFSILDEIVTVSLLDNAVNP